MIDAYVDGRPMLPERVDVICPEDGSDMELRSSRFGPFLVSVQYPKVKFTINLDKREQIKYPTPPALEVAAAHGINLVSRSRQMTRVDLYDHHHVLVADRPVLAKIRSLTGSAFGEIGGPGKAGARVRLLAQLADPHAQGDALDVADPLRGGPEGYLRVYRQIERACHNLLLELAPRAS